METPILIAIMVLILLAALDLWVGVANDAVNFLNSAIGARVASLKTILIIASLGVLLGAVFSDGMMEVARKGVFDPSYFLDAAGAIRLDAILAIYLGVMAADVVMLDLFNTLGLPTSTTVSIISDLVGAALAVAFWMNGGDIVAALKVINFGPVAGIYSAIFLSVFIAFGVAAVAMFGARLLFTHDLKKNFRYVGWLWTGLSFSFLFYFVLLKGGKHTSLITPEMYKSLEANIIYILAGVFAVTAIAAQIFSHRHELIFKVIILTGTCTLAISFAGNDLVNFIGPTVAAGQAVFMEGVNLAGKVTTPWWALSLAGAIMVFALWFSRKARTVTDTEIRLAAHEETEQRFQSNKLARGIVKGAITSFNYAKYLLPPSFRQRIEERTNDSTINQKGKNRPPYDLLRASVNLTVASMLISLGTANKLPLSTTYVTFMVAMGASLADRNWNRKNAADRVAGVLTVVGGWLITAILAASGSFIAASIIYLLGISTGVIVVMILVSLMMIKMSIAHKKKFEKAAAQAKIPVEDAIPPAIGKAIEEEA